MYSTTGYRTKSHVSIVQFTFYSRTCLYISRFTNFACYRGEGGLVRRATGLLQKARVMPGCLGKVSSRTRSRTRREATVVPFVQDAQNVDLVGLILQELLDSTEKCMFPMVEVTRERTDSAGVVHKYKTFGRPDGGLFEGIQYDSYKCTNVLVQALSLVCRMWDEVRSPITHPTAPPA